MAKIYVPSILTASCVPTEDGFQGTIDLKENFIVRFTIKNVLNSLAEGNLGIIIEPLDGFPTRPFKFYLKAHSDSNKEALARQLKLAFSNFSSSWTLIVNELTVNFIEALNNKKQIVRLSEVTAEQKAWLFEPFIYEHSINIFFGLGSGGKTLIALYLSMLYAQGKSLWGKEGRQGNILLMDFENDEMEWRDRIYGIAGKQNISVEDLDKKIFYWKTEQIPLYNQIEKVKTAIRENNITLVIVDSASMAAGDSTSDEASALRLMAALKLLDISVLLIAHQRKNEGEDSPIGSVQYFNQARNIWHIDSIPDDSDEKLLHMACKHTKCNIGRKRKNPIGIKAFFGEGYIDIHLEDAMANFEEKFSLHDRIVNSLKGGAHTPKQLAEEIGKTENNIRTALTRLKGKRKVVNIDGTWIINPSEEKPKELQWLK